MQIFKNKKAVIGLILAVILGFAIRAWKLRDIPYPPSGDELAYGYYGWSLLHFGTDEYGSKLPLYFPSIGDYKYPVLAYLNTIPAAIFGLSDITIRFWSLMSGVILIVSAAVITEMVFGSALAAVGAAFMIALNPWSVALSRASYESNVAVMLASMWLIVFWKYLQNKKQTKKYLVISLLLLAMTIFCYSATRVFFVAFLGLLTGVTILNKNWKRATKPMVGYLILAAIICGISFIPWQSRARASSVTIFNLRAEERNRLEQLYVEAGISPIHLPPRVTWFFHNKWRVVGLNFLKEYTSYFSPRFWFFSGSPSNEAIPDVGVLLLIQLLILPVGLLMMIRDNKRLEVMAVIIWLLAAPLAASLTPDGPNMVRAAMMIPVLAIISGYGISLLVSLRWMLVVGTVWSTLFFANQMFIQKPTDGPWTTHQGTREMVKDVWAMRDRYKAVAIGEDNYIAFLYYNQISPKEFLAQSTILPTSKTIQWDRVERLDNIYFKMPYECPKSGKVDVLYVCKGMNIPQNARVLKVYRFWDGIPHYTLVTFVSYKEIEGKSLPGLPDRLRYMPDYDSRNLTGIIPESEKGLW